MVGGAGLSWQAGAAAAAAGTDGADGAHDAAAVERRIGRDARQPRHGASAQRSQRWCAHFTLTSSVAL